MAKDIRLDKYIAEAVGITRKDAKTALQKGRVRELSKENYVFVSEQNAPADFDMIWEMEAKRTNGANNNFKATEKLFRYKDGLL